MNHKLNEEAHAPPQNPPVYHCICEALPDRPGLVEASHCGTVYRYLPWAHCSSELQNRGSDCTGLQDLASAVLLNSSIVRLRAAWNKANQSAHKNVEGQILVHHGVNLGHSFVACERCEQ